jgi:hypothetical protein
MSQSSTLYIGLDVHKDSMAVAYIAQAHGAEVISLGVIKAELDDDLPSQVAVHLYGPSVAGSAACRRDCSAESSGEGFDGWKSRERSSCRLPRSSRPSSL